MRASSFYIEKNTDKRKWAACTFALLAVACGAWVMSAAEPPRTGVVVKRQPKLDSVSFESPSPFDAVTVTAGAARDHAEPMLGTAAVPRSPAPPQPTATASTTEDLEALAMYRGMDAKLRPGAPAPEWAPMGTLAAEVTRAESNTTISHTACAEEFCRVDLQTASGMDQSALVETLLASLAARGSALMIRYPQDQTNQVVVYVLKPEPSPTQPATPRIEVNP